MKQNNYQIDIDSMITLCKMFNSPCELLYGNNFSV